MLRTHETERTDFGGKSSVRTWFTTGGPQADDFNFTGILERGRISRRHRREAHENTDEFWGHCCDGLWARSGLDEAEQEAELWLGVNCTVGKFVGREAARSGSHMMGGGPTEAGEDRTFVFYRHKCAERSDYRPTDRHRGQIPLWADGIRV